MGKAEKFVNDFMQAFDENGLGAPEKVMYLRAYQELEVLKRLKAKNLAIHDVSKCAFVFDCRDTQGRKAQIFIEAKNRETAIAIFESDYEGYKWWQTSEKHFC